MRRKFTVELSEKGIDNAIKELNEYKRDFIKKTELFHQKVAEYVAKECEHGFSCAIVDDTINAEPRYAHVDISLSKSGDTIAVIADGQDAVWVEFGAGVYHNSSVGQSPNPNGAELGFTIGSFGPNGSKKTWGYYDAGDLILTHGTEARMPMANAITSVCNDISKIAKEVWR